MHIVLISTPIGFLGSGKGGGVELTLSSLVTGLLAKGHKVDVVAPKNSKLIEACSKAKLHCVEGNEQKSWQHQDYYSLVTIPDNSLLSGMIEKAIAIGKKADIILNFSYLKSMKPIIHSKAKIMKWTYGYMRIASIV